MLLVPPPVGAVVRRHERGLGRGSVGAKAIAGRAYRLVSDESGARTNDVDFIFANGFRRLVAPKRERRRNGCVRQNRVVLAPVAGAKLCGGEVTQPGFDFRR